MLIEITPRHNYGGIREDKISEIAKAFFKAEGIYKAAEYGDGVDVKFIGVVDIVPAEVLNDQTFEKSFFKNHKEDFDTSSLVALAETFNKENFEKAKETPSPIHIHIPSPELSFFNQVDWLEDACTQAIQKELDDGWRIIACIPRPGQRRPDYILGRRK